MGHVTEPGEKQQSTNKKAKFYSVVNRHQLTDFQRLNTELRYWQYDLRQIEPGAFAGALLQVGDEDFHITHCSYNLTVEHRGKAPDNNFSFVFLDVESSSFCFRKQKIDQYGLLTLQPGDELKGISHSNFNMYGISMHPDMLEMKTRLYDMPMLNAWIKQKRVLNVLPTYLRNLTGKIHRYFDQVQNAKAPLSDEVLTKLQDEIISCLLLTISPNQQDSVGISSSCQVLEKAIDYINAQAQHRLTMQDICKTLNVSERTLQYAFKEHFGVTPVNYMRAIRLNKVYQALANSDSSAMISDIARVWGFNHMSQFTADYKKHFGELPSDTLARG